MSNYRIVVLNHVLSVKQMLDKITSARQRGRDHFGQFALFQYTS